MQDYGIATCHTQLTPSMCFIITRLNELVWAYWNGLNVNKDMG